MGLHVFLLHLFSILYTLSLCDGNVPFVLACRAMLTACVHARAVLLLNNLLCFLFLRSFVLSFVLFFFLSLVTEHSFNSNDEKKFSIRTHTYE
jgi:hypothetical protein